MWQRCGFWSGGYLSLFVDGLVGLGFGWDLLGFALSCVFGCGGCGGCVVEAVGCWQQCDGC